MTDHAALIQRGRDTAERLRRAGCPAFAADVTAVTDGLEAAIRQEAPWAPVAEHLLAAERQPFPGYDMHDRIDQP